MLPITVASHYLAFERFGLRMSVAAPTLQHSLRRTLLIQALLILVVAVGFMLIQGWLAAVAALYGGAITLIGTWWIGRRVQYASELLLKGHPGQSSLVLYAGAALRFIFAAVALALGMAVLKLGPVPQLTAFALAYLGYIFGAKTNG